MKAKRTLAILGGLLALCLVGGSILTQPAQAEDPDHYLVFWINDMRMTDEDQQLVYSQDSAVHHNTGYMGSGCWECPKASSSSGNCTSVSKYHCRYVAFDYVLWYVSGAFEWNERGTFESDTISEMNFVYNQDDGYGGEDWWETESSDSETIHERDLIGDNTLELEVDGFTLVVEATIPYAPHEFYDIDFYHVRFAEPVYE